MGFFPERLGLMCVGPVSLWQEKEEQECELKVYFVSDVPPSADIRLIDWTVNGCREVSSLATIDLGLSVDALIAFIAHFCA